MSSPLAASTNALPTGNKLHTACARSKAVRKPLCSKGCSLVVVLWMSSRTLLMVSCVYNVHIIALKLLCHTDTAYCKMCYIFIMLLF